MNTKQLDTKRYSDLVACNNDYVPDYLSMVAGIAFDPAGMHLTVVDLTPEARYDLLDWSNLPEFLTLITAGRDWYLRYVDEIVIDTDSSALNASQVQQQQSIIEAILALPTNLRVRHGRASADIRPLDGKQRSIAAATFGFERKLGSLRRLFRKSCQQLDSSEKGDTTPII